MTVTIAEPDLVETRSGEGFEVADVNFPKRVVTVVAMPYEKPAEVVVRGRAVTEVVSRGAFEGVEKRAGQIRTYRDHAHSGVVGKIIGLHPSRKEGLVSEVKIFQTPLGDETLTLCDEGGLDASVGFGLLRRDDGRVWEGAETWERNRTVRRLNRLWLDHLALVPDPAYPDATVLSVRNAPPGAQETPGGDAMPNRDRLTVQEQKAAHEALNRRWLM
jgi:HK97 family phage prohead protease